MTSDNTFEETNSLNWEDVHGGLANAITIDICRSVQYDTGPQIRKT